MGGARPVIKAFWPLQACKQPLGGSPGDVLLVSWSQAQGLSWWCLAGDLWARAGERSIPPKCPTCTASLLVFRWGQIPLEAPAHGGERQGELTEMSSPC